MHTESTGDGIGLVLFPHSYDRVDRAIIPAWQVQPEQQHKQQQQHHRNQLKINQVDYTGFLEHL